MGVTLFCGMLMLYFDDADDMCAQVIVGEYHFCHKKGSKEGHQTRLENSYLVSE